MNQKEQEALVKANESLKAENAAHAEKIIELEESMERHLGELEAAIESTNQIVAENESLKAELSELHKKPAAPRELSKAQLKEGPKKGHKFISGSGGGLVEVKA